MNTQLKTILAALFLFTSIFISANNKHGYQINVMVHGISDTIAILAYHQGNRQLVEDTVRVDGNGRFNFSGTERLPGGIYIVVLPGQEFFEFIIDENQHFGIETHKDDLVATMRFADSPENESFYDYIRFISQKNQTLAPIRAELQKQDIDPNRRVELQEKLQNANQIVKARQDEIIDRFRGGLLSAMLLAQQDVPLPPTKLRPDGTTDHEYMYQQYKRNYLNNIDFSDARLVRTPVFHSRLHQFFNNVLIQIPDSIIREADIILERARANSEVFRYTLTYITNNFERSQIMGMDAVFVHMVEKYYMTGQAFWVAEPQLQRITERAMAMKPTLIGNIAPDIAMSKPDGTSISLHSVESNFTILYFWDSECSHCRRNTPLLKEFYTRMKPKGVEIFAVNTEADRARWIDYIVTNELNWINVNDAHNQTGFREKYDIWSTPLLFVLDANKEIIAKKISVEQAEDIINRELQQP